MVADQSTIVRDKGPPILNHARHQLYVRNTDFTYSDDFTCEDFVDATRTGVVTHRARRSPHDLRFFQPVDKLSSSRVSNVGFRKEQNTSIDSPQPVGDMCVGWCRDAPSIYRSRLRLQPVDYDFDPIRGPRLLTTVLARVADYLFDTETLEAPYTTFAH